MAKKLAKKTPKTQYQAVYSTAEAAREAANSRTEGPRKVYEVELAGKVYHVVHINAGRAAGAVLMAAGGKVRRTDRVRKFKRPLTTVEILAALAALPEAERKSILKS